MRNPINKNLRITSSFGMRTLNGVTAMHNGIDLVPTDGKHPVDIVAVCDGVVIAVVSNLPDTHTGINIASNTAGNYVYYQTPEGYTVRCMHLKAGSVKVKKGDRLKAGDKIGVMGTTGRSTGVHLHYEFRGPKGVAFDPQPYLGNERTFQPSAPIPSVDLIKLATIHASAIIFANEGNYDSVNRDDNGALSIGKVQWRASRALSLMKTIVAKAPAEAKSILGDALFNEILNVRADAWNTRTVTVAEGSRLSALLITPQGMAAQDALAETDISAYIQKGQSYGLTDCGALIFFADGVNQFGTNSALWKNIVEKALKTTGDVTAMFEASKGLLSAQYIPRRERVYKAVLALNLDSKASNTSTAPFVPYLVRVTANELNIRKGAGINHASVGCIKDKGTYTIVEEASGSGATKWGRLKSGAGWISLDFTKKA